MNKSDILKQDVLPSELGIGLKSLSDNGTYKSFLAPTDINIKNAVIGGYSTPISATLTTTVGAGSIWLNSLKVVTGAFDVTVNSNTDNYIEIGPGGSSVILSNANGAGTPATAIGGILVLKIVSDATGITSAGALKSTTLPRPITTRGSSIDISTNNSPFTYNQSLVAANIAIGESTLTYVTTGAQNIGIGNNALPGNSGAGLSGSDNIGIGYQSGFNLTTGAQNTLYGRGSGSYITSGSANVGIGHESMKGNSGTGLSGSYNTGIGYQTGFNLTTGQYNVLNGYQAGYSLTTSHYNVMIGYKAGTKNTIGYDNVLIGQTSGQYITEGYRNVALGKNSLASSYGASTATATDNIAIGSFTLSKAINGSSNTSVGDNASAFITNGNFNTSIGMNAGKYSDSGTTALSTFDDTICVGHGAYATASNEMSLGNSTYITAAYTAVAFATRSDERQKDFYDMDLGLDFVTSITPRKYKWKEDAEASDKDSYFYGFSAQEVKANLPTDDKYGMHRTQGEEDGVQNLTYTEMIAPLYKAIQEMKQIIDAQQLEINTLKGL
jgi:trimeric autotransporter adhesin